MLCMLHATVYIQCMVVVVLLLFLNGIHETALSEISEGRIVERVWGTYS